VPVLTVPAFFTVTGLAAATFFVAGFFVAVLALPEPNWGSLKAIVTGLAVSEGAEWQRLGHIGWSVRNA
jgi:hypothetical protein